MRGELGRVEDDAGAVRVRGGGEFADRPQLAGDVGGAGDADQGRAVGVAVGEGALQGLHSLRGAVGGLEERHPARPPPRQQRRVVLGLEHEDLAAVGEGGGEQVEGVGGGAGEHQLVVGAAVEELGDGPASVLEQVGGELGEVAGAAVDAAVVGRVGGHVVPDALEGGGAGGVVEGGVGDLAAGDERDGDVPAEDGQRGADGRLGGDGGGFGDGGGSSRHDGTPVGRGIPRASGRPDNGARSSAEVKVKRMRKRGSEP